MDSFRMYSLYSLFFIISLFTFYHCSSDDGEDDPEPVEELLLQEVKIGAVSLILNTTVEIDQLDAPIVCNFSTTLDKQTVLDNLVILSLSNQEMVEFDLDYSDGDKTISLQPKQILSEQIIYALDIKNGLKGSKGEKFSGAGFSFQARIAPLELELLVIDGISMLTTERIKHVSREFEIQGSFSHPVDLQLLKSRMSINDRESSVDIKVIAGNEENSFVVQPESPVEHLQLFNFEINSNFTSIGGNKFGGIEKSFYTALDSTDKFPRISDDELLTKVQQQTFKYFWDFGHPVSGLSRERNSSTQRVTSGGSGFGLMAIVVGMERGFITREEGLTRLETIVQFLGDADRFHGAWSHWLNGTTGEALPFSPNDDGGDLVETSYMAMGLLTVRQYLNPSNTRENTLIFEINQLWESIEWDWYTRGGQDVLFWHWSPRVEWAMNLKIGGYNEALITYIMAAASPTHPIDSNVYHNGWAKNGNIVNGNNIYGYYLPLGRNKGGPLFFEQYTYLGIDPRNLEDRYANYWQQCVNHTLINREHCILNPHNYIAYSENCWGLTASDNDEGYSAHSPTNDRGVITPTAALSSMAYTPDESLDALHFFYYKLGDKLWGEYGFYDAFNPTAGWVASSYLAIDQGPIIGMIENYRTGLLWDLFMSCPEVQQGLTKLGFSY